MKVPSIALLKAIVLSLCLIVPSGFLAQAAEGELTPKLLKEKDLTSVNVDVDGLAARGYQYETIDQLAIEHLMGL